MENNKKIFRGGIWSVSSRLFVQVINLGVYMMLAQVLDPEVFGLAAMLLIVAMLFEVLTRQGIVEIIMREDVCIKNTSTLFWYVQISALVFLSMFMLGLDYILNLTAYTELSEAINYLYIIFPLISLSVVSRSLLMKSFKYKEISVGTNIGAIFGVIAAVALVEHGFGVESLIAMHLSNKVVEAFVVVYYARWKPKFYLDVMLIKRVMIFNVQILIVNLISFFNSQLDKILVGALLGAYALGLYTIGYKLVGVLLQLIPSALEPVLLSSFSEKLGRLKKLKLFYLISINFSSLLLFPAFFCMAVVSEELVVSIFGEKWIESAILLSIFSFQGVVYSLALINPIVLRVLGKGKWLMNISVVNLLVSALLIFLGSYYGVVGVAVAIVIRAFLMACFNLYKVKEELGFSYREYMLFINKPLSICIFVCFLTGFLFFNLSIDAGFYVLIIKLFSFCVLYLFMMLILSRKLIHRLKLNFL